MNSFITEAHLELDRIKALIQIVDKIPFSSENEDGCLACRIENNKLKYYHVNSKQVDGKRKRQWKYLGGPGNTQVQSLKKAKVYREIRKRLVENQQLLTEMLSAYQKYDPESVTQSLPDSYRLLPAALQTDFSKQEIKEWALAEYKKNPMTFPDMDSIAVDGTKVRSKGDLIIYNLLKRYKIPFRYDERLVLINGDREKVLRYPDFTILLRDGTKLYWEHLRLLNKEGYRISTSEKMKLYQQNGITPGYNLIVTGDSRDGGINTALIDQIIRGVVLPLVHTID